MEQLLDLVKQIQDIAGVIIEALSEAAGGEGGAPEGAGPPAEGGAPPPEEQAA